MQFKPANHANRANLIRLIGVLLLPAYLCAADGELMLQDGDRIVFLGDSITQAASQPEGYISLFQLFCGVNGYEVGVVNAGISGHKSNDMLRRLETDVLAHDPDWVSVSCGVNDVWHGDRGVPLNDYKKNMTEIVDRIRSSGARVLLLTSTPIYEDLNTAENQRLRSYNEFLRQLAAEKDLVLADLFEAFAAFYRLKLNDENLLTTDGVHMNLRGNRLMAREIVRALGGTNRELALAEKRWELVNNTGGEKE